MALPPILQAPRQGAAVVDDKGIARNDWYEFFRQLIAYLGQAGVDPAVIAEILARLDALEADQLGPFLILGPLSVQVQGTPQNGNVLVQLVGDVASPGRLYAYRVDDDGNRGWSLIRPDETPSSIGVYMQDENGDWIIDEDNRFAQSDLLLQVAADPDSLISNVQQAFNVMTSPGIITGGEVTELTTTSVRITGGSALLRVADDNVSELRFFAFDSQDFSVPDVQVTHFYALDYNGGNPIMVESTVSENWDRDTQIPLGSALRGDGILNVTPNPYRTGDVVTNLIQRLDAIGPVQRDNSVGGLALGETGARNVTVSAGRLWSRVSDFTIAAKNSTMASMQSVFFNGTNLTVTSGITQWDNLNFNNLGTGSLQLMGNNKYANLWFFMSFNGDHYGFAYGTNEYNTLGDAANEGVPAYLTQNFFNQFILLGRFIFQKSAATASIIESAFVTPFTSSAINTHNNLGGLQGGTTNEYYHFTNSEHTDLSALAALATGIPAHTGADTWAARTITAGAGISVTNGDGVAGNPTITSAVPGEITGLKLIWNSATSISVSSGSAHIESTGVLLNSTSTITKSGLSLSASTWYHVYLFSNAGTPDIEIVTTAPASAYNGNARSKSGDTTRRYMGSLRTDGSGNLYNVTHVDGRIYYRVSLNTTRCLSNGTATVNTSVDLSPFVPVTGQQVGLKCSNGSSAAAYFVRGHDSSAFFDYAEIEIAPVGGFSAFFLDINVSTTQTIEYRYLAAPGASGAYIDIASYVLDR